MPFRGRRSPQDGGARHVLSIRRAQARQLPISADRHTAKPRQGRPFNSAVPRAPKSAGRRGQARPVYPTGASPSTAHKCRQAHRQAPSGATFQKCRSAGAEVRRTEGPGTSYLSDGRKPVKLPTSADRHTAKPQQGRPFNSAVRHVLFIRRA